MSPVPTASGYFGLEILFPGLCGTLTRGQIKDPDELETMTATYSHDNDHQSKAIYTIWGN